MSSSAAPGARLRAALDAERPLQIVGAVTAFSALLAERAGFRALYLSGAGVANSSFGLPDLGITTLNDVCEDVRRLTAACPTLPLLVDADTGFGGGAFNVARTVRELTRAGAAGCHLEDQVAAKRCGHRPGKELVSADEMCDRLKAAADARGTDSFVLMARTDAAAGEGVPAAIARARAYVAAGADTIFAEALRTLDDFRAFTTALGPDVPVLGEHHRVRPDAAVHGRGTARGRRADGAVSVERLPGDGAGGGGRLPDHPGNGDAGWDRGRDADASGALRGAGLPRLRGQAGRAVREAALLSDDLYPRVVFWTDEGTTEGGRWGR